MGNNKCIIKNLVLGDESAFNNYCKLNQKKIERICYSFLHNKQCAEDMRQEVLLEIFENKHKFRNNAEFETWIYSIIKGKCISQLRKNKIRATQALDVGYDNKTFANEPPINKQEQPDELFEYCETKLLLLKSINKLNQQCKKTIKLRYYEELSIKQTANKMKLSVSRTEKILKITLRNLLSKKVKITSSFYFTEVRTRIQTYEV